MAFWLDDRHRWRRDQSLPTAELRPVTPITLKNAALRVELVLGIPRGQDFLIGSAGGRVQADPQSVIAADGKHYWCIAGATLRGLFRAWISRLAARQGLPVAFSRARAWAAINHQNEITGEDVGWCFLNQEPDFKPERAAQSIKCPVAQLFGSLAGHGRIHITDALAPALPTHQQTRTHVVIDPISGGAIERLLFSNPVLVDCPVDTLRFPTTILVDRPTQQEAQWLSQAIHALNQGLIRVGSSKAAGRLALAHPPCATGPFADVFNNLPLTANYIGGRP